MDEAAERNRRDRDEELERRRILAERAVGQPVGPGEGNEFGASGREAELGLGRWLPVGGDEELIEL